MGRLCDEWRELRKQLGVFTSELNNLADMYDSKADAIASAKAKGYSQGYQSGVQECKDGGLCEKCNHKATAEAACKYADMLKKFDELSYVQQEAVKSVIRNMKKK